MKNREVTTGDMNAEQLDELMYAISTGSKLRIKTVFEKVRNTPRIYIAGKITGIEDEAPFFFEHAEDEFTKNGYKAINPMKLPHDHDKSWESYMRECIAALVTCDYIFLLPNWTESKGARLEQAIAHNLKIKQLKL